MLHNNKYICCSASIFSLYKSQSIMTWQSFSLLGFVVFIVVSVYGSNILELLYAYKYIYKYITQKSDKRILYN